MVIKLYVILYSQTHGTSTNPMQQVMLNVSTAFLFFLVRRYLFTGIGPSTSWKLPKVILKLYAPVPDGRIAPKTCLEMHSKFNCASPDIALLPLLYESDSSAYTQDEDLAINNPHFLAAGISPMIVQMSSPVFRNHSYCSTRGTDLFIDSNFYVCH
jgi:hypothetical protein